MNLLAVLLIGANLLAVSAFAKEGFYALDQLPKDTQGIMPQVVAAGARSTGILLMTRKMVLDREKARKMKEWMCSTAEERVIEGPYCERLASPECGSGCKIDVRRARCTGVRMGAFFVVSKHCLTEVEDPRDPQAMFFDSSGKSAVQDLELTSETLTQLPYDLAIYRIHGSDPKAPTLKLAIAQKGEAVFGIGVPFLGYRKDLAAKTYSKTEGIRATFGKVVEPNTAVGSFCQFTNENAADAETWKLESGCKSKPKDGRHEERDPLLTDTDMTYGMSGSPLFNAKGELLGIGSNVLSGSPENYAPDKYAVFVKAAHAQEAIARLSE